MKIKSLIAAVISAAMLTGCSLLEDEETSGIADSSSDLPAASSSVEQTELSHGTGLQEIEITAKQDPDPNKQIKRRRTPVRQIRGIDVNGNTLSNDFYFYRNILSGTYKQAYDQIYSALYNGVQTVQMSVSVPSTDIADIVYCVYYDHPELFWVDSSLTYYMNGSGIVTSLTVNFNGTANNLKRSQQTFENAIAPLIKLAASVPEDIEKVKLVHDYLTNTIQYVAGSQYNQSAYSAIVNGKTVCAGYAHAFQYCMQKLGIPAAYIVGHAGESHAWNLLKLDGEYYCMDVTWDDPIGNPANTYYYSYFNITDSQISRDHTRYEISAALPAANGTKYSFNSYFGGNAFGSDFSGLDGSATMPSDFNNTAPSVPQPEYSQPEYSQPEYSQPEYSQPEYSQPEYSQPDDDYGYIDGWSDDDWDKYWDDFDSWLNSNGFDDINYNSYSDWEDYYFGDDCDDWDDWDYYDDFDDYGYLW